jgi:hypothetical protein
LIRRRVWRVTLRLLGCVAIAARLFRHLALILQAILQALLALAETSMVACWRADRQGGLVAAEAEICAAGMVPLWYSVGVL